MTRFAILIILAVLLAGATITCRSGEQTAPTSTFSEGWCCENGEVYRATEEDCEANGGTNGPIDTFG